MSVWSCAWKYSINRPDSFAHVARRSSLLLSKELLAGEEFVLGFVKFFYDVIDVSR